MAIRGMLPELWRGERGLWSPFREMSRLQRRMDRMFEELSLPEEEGGFAPACDVEETDTHFLVSFDLPGMRKEDVQIELQENQLIVSGERKQEKKEEAHGRLSRERYYGSFRRSFALPSGVAADKVEASYENGVLHIALPKTKAAVGKQIPIKEKRTELKSEKAA